MKNLVYLSLVLFAGCTTINSTSRQEKERVEVSMHKIRTDLEEIKHDLNTHQMELHILEGKLLNHEDQVLSIKGDTIDEQSEAIKQLKDISQTLDKRIAKIEKKQVEMIEDLKAFEKHTKEIHLALVQYKTKFSEIEKMMQKQTASIQEMKKVKDDLTDLLLSSETYKVKAGDSLEKIAKKFQVDVESLKKANHIQSDLIMIGQELVIPNKK